MVTRWNNLVGRGLALVLLVLFALPCIDCDDAVGRWLVQEGHGSVQSIHCAEADCGCTVCGANGEETPPCSCLSDTEKVFHDRPLTAPIVSVVALLPADLNLLSEPSIVEVARPEPEFIPPSLFAYPAVADRAPPAV